MTDVTYSFKSDKNKGIIWGLMNEYGVFKGIDNSYASLVKTDFDTKVEYISRSIASSDNLINLNKRVITEMMADMTKKYKGPGTGPEYKGPEYKGTVPVTSAEALLQKQTIFQKNLQTKQTEFDSLIQKAKPTTIDFADNAQDKPNGEEMERKLAETIAWREKQLNVVLDTQDKTEANIWINRDNNIKIDQKTPVDINVIHLDNSKKKVSFTEQNESLDKTFLSLLKKKPTNEDDMLYIKNKLNEISEKQNEILYFLKQDKGAN